MAAVKNTDAVLFPFYATLKTQTNLKTVPLGAVNSRWTTWRRSDYFYPEMIPEPDYSDSDDVADESNDEDFNSADERLRDVEEKKEQEDDRTRKRIFPVYSSDSGWKSETTPRSRRAVHSDEGLIKPKKPVNPYLESTERQKLHKELKFNQKYGKSGGNQRSELQKALEKYTEGKIKRDLAASRRSSLEKILEQQALKIEMHERESTGNNQPAWIDSLHRQHMTRRTDPKMDEFFQVHARVVSNLMGDNFSITSVESSHPSSTETSSKSSSDSY